MSNNIQLHKNDLPDDLMLGNTIAVDGEFMGLNVRRDPLCLIQISSGNSDAHIVQFDRKNYHAPNLVKLLSDDKTQKPKRRQDSLTYSTISIIASTSSFVLYITVPQCVSLCHQ